MNQQRLVLSSPMLVIGTGEFADRLLPELQTLFLRSDRHYSAMVRFCKTVMADEKNEVLGFRAIPKNDGTTPAPAPGADVVGKEQASLESVLHDLRLHENFLQMGLGNGQDLPLGVIVLADLTEQGSESLYALINGLLEKMTKEPDSYMYLLCKTAIFEESPMRHLRQARLYLHLSKLKLLERAGLRFQIYLFDTLKEGWLEAKDENEIGVLMQNFLFALLSGRLGQKLADVYALTADDQAEMFYHSAGTTVMIYDPSMLQEICANQLAARTLGLEFLSENHTDPNEIEKLAKAIFESLGWEREWIEKLCIDTPYRDRSTESIRLDLHLSDLQFEDLPPQEWGDAIVGYASHFEKELQTGYLVTLAKNSESLSQNASQTLEAQLDRLTARRDLYPGTVTASLQLIRQCAKLIDQRIQACVPVQNEEETAAFLDDDYQSAIERLDAAISALPEPPRWVMRLPGKLRTYSKMLFDFVFLRKEHAQLILLREKIVQALERKFIFQFKQQIRGLMVELFNQLLASLEKARFDLEALQSKFQSLKKRLEVQDLPASLPSSPFRYILMTPELLQWAYDQAKNDNSGIRTDLLEHDYLKNWREVSEEHLYDQLLAACMSCFESLNDFGAEEVLKQAGPGDLSSMMVSLAQGAVPVLRPDFDATGETTSYLANYFLYADPRESGIPGILKNSAREQHWQEITTGDPCVIMFCRVRQMISVNALSLLFQSAQAAFESLSEQEQKELQEIFEGARP